MAYKPKPWRETPMNRKNVLNELADSIGIQQSTYALIELSIKVELELISLYLTDSQRISKELFHLQMECDDSTKSVRKRLIAQLLMIASHTSRLVDTVNLSLEFDGQQPPTSGGVIDG
jgi:hypothetical protein